MGCQIWLRSDHNVGLFFSCGGRLVMALTSRWEDPARDTDGEFHTTGIGALAMTNLDNEAPSDIVKFDEYCRENWGRYDQMSSDMLLQVRKFIADAAKDGSGVYCSH
jgi:hypothetical protein